MDEKETEFVKSAIKKHVTELFDRVLDYAEIGIPHTEQYKKFRSKVLRLGNNCIRNLNTVIDKGEPIEPIIEIKNGGVKDNE